MSPGLEAFFQKVVGYGVFVAMAAGIWLMMDNTPFSSERTVYLGWCPTPLVNGTCPKGEESGNPTTYRADRETNSVTHWTDGSPPRSYQNCAIRDASNWSCHIDDNYEVSMVDDKVTETGGLLADMYYPVPKWRWYWLRLHTKTF